MNRADRKSEGAGVIGILLVGFGLWWGDAVAAGIISLNIIHDGWHNLQLVLADLMDESPTKMGGKDLEPLPERLRAAALAFSWVRHAAVRLREQGAVLSGDVFVVPRDEATPVRNIEQANQELLKLDWRLYSLTITPVSELDGGHPPRHGDNIS